MYCYAWATWDLLIITQIYDAHLQKSEILRRSEKGRAIHLDKSDGYKIKRTNVEELKLWVGTRNTGSRTKNVNQKYGV